MEPRSRNLFEIFVIQWLIRLRIRMNFLLSIDYVLTWAGGYTVSNKLRTAKDVDGGRVDSLLKPLALAAASESILLREAPH